MNLYLISQDINGGYDTYDAAVVAASSEEEARNSEVGSSSNFGDWASTDKIKVELIGKAIKGTKAGIILASFNAG